MENKNINEDELIIVYCLNCNNQLFKFSKELLKMNEIVRLLCPKCNEEIKVTNKDTGGIIIGKY